MNIPKNLLYTEKHEWLNIEGDTAVIGITDHAQEELGDIVFINLPQVGDALEKGGEVAELESVKAAAAVYAPVGGTVCEANEALIGQPELINQDPYGAWFVKLKDFDKPEALMDAAQYEKFLAEENA